jgi:SHS2 domain-containing protein
MTSSYKFIDHTADIAFDVEADTLHELFMAAALAWGESVTDSDLKTIAKDHREVEIQAGSVEQLLVDFLSELNYLLFTGRWLCYFVEKILIVNEKGLWFLSSVLKGAEISKEIIIKQEIKAVTYHQMEIVNENSKFKTKVVFDI